MASSPEKASAVHDDEKHPHPHTNSHPGHRHHPHTPVSEAVQQRIHEFGEKEGYIIDAESGGAGSSSDNSQIKLAADGRTRLIPQPSDDPNDPLNWSWGKKHLVLFIVSMTAFLPDYGSATGAVTLLPQAVQWNMTPDEVNHSQAGNVFMLGVGGVFVVMLSAYIGRLPVVFWFVLIATATAAWCAGATTFESFMAARILNGFFSTVCQVAGLMFIQDMFFFHERARKINVWASFFVMSPYVGPLFAAFMIETQSWPVPFWVYFATNVLCLVLIIGWLPETYYDRSIPAAEQPKLTGNRVAVLTGLSQWRSRGLRNSLGQACWRTISVLLKPTIFLANVYYMLTFAWAVGINTTLAMFLGPAYGFEPKQIGFFYFTPVVAVTLGEITGHWLHDLLARRYIRSHAGRFEPEVRLRAALAALPFTVAGLALVGSSLEGGWHYMGASVSWGLYVFGVMVTTVALSSYCLDSYPEASGEVSAWLNNSRTVGGFIISYLQVSWATAQGTRTSMGIQSAVVAAAAIIVVVLVRWGKPMRVWSGSLNFATT